jgi:pimeloyl-ACP methyl ester carboxylesterase
MSRARADDDVTIVLIHGGASSSAFWDLLVPHLAQPSYARRNAEAMEAARRDTRVLTPAPR